MFLGLLLSQHKCCWWHQQIEFCVFSTMEDKNKCSHSWLGSDEQELNWVPFPAICFPLKSLTNKNLHFIDYWLKITAATQCSSLIWERLSPEIWKGCGLGGRVCVYVSCFLRLTKSIKVTWRFNKYTGSLDWNAAAFLCLTHVTFALLLDQQRFCVNNYSITLWNCTMEEVTYCFLFCRTKSLDTLLSCGVYWHLVWIRLIMIICSKY